MIDLSPKRASAVRSRIEAGCIPEPMSGCWIWLKAVTATGYAKMQVRPFGAKPAARFVHAAFNGPVPTGLFVRHRCDTPLCVNPDHLLLGTPAENTGDMVRRGRQSAGMKNGQAKLTDAAVSHIRRSRERLRPMAERYGVTESTISAIRLGKLWNSNGAAS